MIINCPDSFSHLFEGLCICYNCIAIVCLDFVCLFISQSDPTPHPPSPNPCNWFVVISHSTFHSLLQISLSCSHPFLNMSNTFSLYNGIHLHLHLGFVHPLQDVALHQCLPSSSVCCFPNPGGSLLLCYVILPSSAWSSSRPLPSPWLPLCASLCPPIVL